MTEEEVLKEYLPKMVGNLERATEVLRAAGFIVVAPAVMSDEPETNMVDIIITGMGAEVWPDEEAVDITHKVAFQRCCEGPGDGLNFVCDIVERGGRILGGLAPFNRSNNVWVSAADATAVEERWKLFDSVDASGIVDCIERRSR